MMCDMVEPAAKDQVLYCAQRAIICDWALCCGQGSTRKRRRQCIFIVAVTPDCTMETTRRGHKKTVKEKKKETQYQVSRFTENALDEYSERKVMKGFCTRCVK